METYEDIKKGEKGAWISIIAYVFLSLLKLIAGYIGNSQALQADGLNNSTDVVASIAILIGLKIARKPPDEDHRYGHFRAETIASLIAAFIMMAVGLQVLIEAGRSFFDNNQPVPDMLTGWIALFSAVFMFIVYFYNAKLAKSINSKSLMAAAQDNRSDALVSIGAFVGILGAQLGIEWLDVVTAFIVGLIIIKTAWEIFTEASHALTDGYDQEELENIRQTIQRVVGVQHVRSVKARLHGNLTLVDVVVCVNPELNVTESHKITENIEAILLKKYQIRYAIIHIEPADDHFHPI
ncbi:cation diffusion facilitator family transporter [Bacillus sp. REN10]|uniref:cation diffusion facilitator family transporter n=1 Tax=Bacillus sp. REN10 TaxID=2782541 RepID=UPI00193AF98C|nr:cation diffusion facilitator family transporter [Bacillus sp. REN10]